MGDYANDLLNGFCCEECGQFIDGKEPGYPRKCKECDPQAGHKIKNWLAEETNIVLNRER